jgi:hypothetical protein
MRRRAVIALQQQAPGATDLALIWRVCWDGR